MAEIWIEARKWQDAPHRGHAGRVLGTDDHGLWIENRVGTPVYRGDELMFHSTGGGVILVPYDRSASIWFPAHGEYELYVDIAIELRVPSDTAVTLIDLDLDVVRLRNGEVQLLDEDEFELHQRELRYPEEVIAHATQMATRVLADTQAGVEPFDGRAAIVWLERVEP